jgi:hypothetical protein
MSLREARQVWGHRKLVAIACGHHNYDQGAVFLVDYGKGINEADAMRNITPRVSATEGGYGGVKAVPEGGVEDRGGHYMFPYPLSEKSLLVAYSYKRPEYNAGQNFALYYIDVWGNKELIYRDPRMSVAYLAPVRPVPRPRETSEAPELQVPDNGERSALAFVADVHAGWPEVERGRVRYLRIAQKVPWPCVKDDSKSCGFNDLHWMPAAWEPVLGMWDWGAARVIGIVPVEADGSAYFKVPADQTVYFQALDEHYLELRRMRSNVTFRAGETRGCIGCHESRSITPPPRTSIPAAMLRAPSTPVPPLWGDRVVPDFEKHIQPILEGHCSKCHGGEEPAGELDFTSRRVDGYVQSYRTIFGLSPSDETPFSKNYWAIWHPGEPAIPEETHEAARVFLKDVVQNTNPAQLVSLADYMGGSEVSQLREFGSSQSRLALTLLHDPKHKASVALSEEEWIALVTWIDLNAQYWGTFVEKDTHYLSLKTGKEIVPPRRVEIVFPDPWLRPPAGQWEWRDNQTVVLAP